MINLGLEVTAHCSYEEHVSIIAVPPHLSYSIFDSIISCLLQESYVQWWRNPLVVGGDVHMFRLATICVKLNKEVAWSTLCEKRGKEVRKLCLCVADCHLQSLILSPSLSHTYNTIQWVCQSIGNASHMFKEWLRIVVRYSSKTAIMAQLFFRHIKHRWLDCLCSHSTMFQQVADFLTCSFFFALLYADFTNCAKFFQHPDDFSPTIDYDFVVAGGKHI